MGGNIFELASVSPVLEFAEHAAQFLGFRQARCLV